MLNPQTSSVSSFAVLPIITGRWLWFGLQQFTRTQWETVCVQAEAWQVQGLHPKVADGVNRWYDQEDLLMLKTVAEQHHLHVIPYHYCYGPQFGGEQITAEAQLSAAIGDVFGAVIPDIEDQYMGQYESAASFGQQVRTHFKGLWMPTLYANPLDHPVPLLSLNPYMDAWLPQVYFALWNGLAQSALDYVYPQWQHFDLLARQQGQGGLKPILPIISLENNIAAQQVADFITLTHGYGYIGFWHQGCYASYAETIAHTPLPISTTPVLPTSPTPQPTLSPRVFSDDDRQVWTLYKSIAINEHAAIAQSWLRARYQRGWNFGPPLEEEHHVTRGTNSYIEQQFCAARASYETTSGLLTWWTANGPVRV